MNYAQMGAAFLVVLLLGWAGWTVNGWRTEAAAAVTLRHDLLEAKDAARAKDAAVKAAQDASVLLAAQLLDLQEQTRTDISALKRKIPAVVNNSHDCALGADAIRLRNSAAGYPDGVSAPSGRTVAPSATPPAP